MAAPLDDGNILLPGQQLCAYRLVGDHESKVNRESGLLIKRFLRDSTCQVAAREYVKWENPQGGFGVSYALG